MATRRARCTQCGRPIIVPQEAYGYTNSFVCSGCQGRTPLVQPNYPYVNNAPYFSNYPASVRPEQFYYPQPRSPRVFTPPPPPSAYGNKRAVIFGISYGKHVKSLKGSLNDAHCVKYFLTDKLGFSRNSIHMLTDDPEEKNPLRIPTKHNMRAAMRWLVEGCQPGDSLVFYFSGHGSREVDRNMDELDGVDEAICPVDYEHEGKIIDDEINATIVRPLPRGAKLHAIFDTCFSGTILDLPFMCRMNRRGYYGWEDHRNLIGGYKGTRGGIAVCISACDDDGSAADTSAFSGMESSGALTYSFIQAMQDEPKLTYGRLLHAMRSKIRETKEGIFGQNNQELHMNTRQQHVNEPQLSCSEKFDIYSKSIVVVMMKRPRRMKPPMYLRFSTDIIEPPFLFAIPYFVNLQKYNDPYWFTISWTLTSYALKLNVWNSESESESDVGEDSDIANKILGARTQSKLDGNYFRQMNKGYLNLTGRVKGHGNGSIFVIKKLYNNNYYNHRQPLVSIDEQSREYYHDDIKGSFLRKPSSPLSKRCNKRAVLCGVTYNNTNYYARGTIDDVERMKELLVMNLSFPFECIRILTGDSLVFYFSGHGSRELDRNWDKLDGMNETIWPVDYEHEGKIIDVEINATIVRPLPHGAKLHAIFDTCHSGTILDLPFMCRMNRIGCYAWEDHRNLGDKGTRGGIAVCISACDNDGNAAINSGFRGMESFGALTYSFIQAMQYYEPKLLTYGRLLHAMRSTIRETKEGIFGQNNQELYMNTRQQHEPQLSCSEKFDIYSKSILM
ncbi:hypothetical protein RIF29_41617 [Crotalaria pallida]|uniref:Peptidase C14 caspase domain-containing protein n=1 Tax=Crotalaria pallida TaxID=3830 RepID=A0AAN9E7M0_CROPI